MNPAKYASLPDDLKKLIDTTTGPVRAEAFGKAFDDNEKHGRQYMVDKKVEITKLSDSELANIQKTLAPIVDKATSALEKDGKPGKKFLDAYQK
jgi:TRAP-type C4-dicarboxylate transport system substrate-binding protein